MKGFNLVVIGGNLGADPKIRYTHDGNAVVNFDVAVNKKYKTKTGEDKEDIVWVKVNVWGRVAENCGEYLKKGSRVLVQGSLAENKWEDKGTGKRRSRLEVRAFSVTFLGSNESGGREGTPPLDDDVPF